MNHVSLLFINSFLHFLSRWVKNEFQFRLLQRPLIQLGGRLLGSNQECFWCQKTTESNATSTKVTTFMELMKLFDSALEIVKPVSCSDCWRHDIVLLPMQWYNIGM